MSSSYDSKELFNLSSLASKGYPEDANLLLSALFIDFADCYIEIRLLDKGIPPIQLFYLSVSTIQWDLIKKKNSDGYNCYFGVCLRKAQKGDKSSVASISALWSDVDAKDFQEGKSEALSQLQQLPPHLFPSVVVDTGHGYHHYWLLRETEPIKSPQDILRLEAYTKGLALTLHGDSTHDLSRVLRLPGLLNQKNQHNPCVCQIVHWEPERKFNLSDFDDYRAEEILASPKDITFGKEEFPKVDINGLPISHRIRRLIRQGWSATSGYRTRSEADEAVIVALLEAGCDADTIKGIFANTEWGIGAKYREKGRQGDAYLAYSIGKGQQLAAIARPLYRQRHRTRLFAKSGVIKIG